MASVEKYPRKLVYLAETKCREVLALKFIPIGKIAETDGWFED